jgi:hypothetical protein
MPVFMSSQPQGGSGLGSALSAFGPALAQAYDAYKTQKGITDFNKGIDAQIQQQGGIQTPQIGTALQQTPVTPIGSNQFGIPPFSTQPPAQQPAFNSQLQLPQLGSYQNMLGNYSPWPR